MSVTSAERAVIECLLEGMPQRATAAKLGFAVSTVKDYHKRLARKFQIDSKKFHTRVRLAYLLLSGQVHIEVPVPWDADRGVVEQSLADERLRLEGVLHEA